MPRINKYRTGRLKPIERPTFDPLVDMEVSAELQATQEYIELVNQLSEGARTTGIMYVPATARRLEVDDGELVKMINKRLRKKRRK